MASYKPPPIPPLPSSSVAPVADADDDADAATDDDDAVACDFRPRRVTACAAALAVVVATWLRVDAEDDDTSLEVEALQQ
jgi:hypothetical protein